MKVLIVEKSPLVSGDISATLQEAFAAPRIVTYRNGEGARRWLETGQIPEIAVVSASATDADLRQELLRSGARIVLLQEGVRELDARAQGEVAIGVPFTADMLRRALARINDA